MEIHLHLLKVRIRPNICRPYPILHADGKLFVMSRLTDQVAEAIENLIDANDSLRSQLQINDDVLGDVLELISGGASVAETLKRVPTVEHRRAIDEAVRLVYDARQHVRQVVIPAAVAEGVDVSNIASAFGVTLEVVAGHAHESAQSR